MSEWDDQAIILRIGHFRERDLWIKTLCREHGTATLFAFGGAASKRRFCGCLDLGNQIECHVKSSHNGAYLDLKEASLVNAPRLIREDWRKTGVAINCLRFMEACGAVSDSSAECFKVLQNLQACLETDFSIYMSFPFFFRLRIASSLGFPPDFHYCSRCGCAADGNVLFMADEGRILCGPCAQKRARGMSAHDTPLSHNALDALRMVVRAMPEKWLALDLSARDLQACGRVAESFIQYHLGLAWNNGYFKRV